MDAKFLGPSAPTAGTVIGEVRQRKLDQRKGHDLGSLGLLVDACTSASSGKIMFVPPANQSTRLQRKRKFQTRLKPIIPRLRSSTFNCLCLDQTQNRANANTTPMTRDRAVRFVGIKDSASSLFDSEDFSVLAEEVILNCNGLHFTIYKTCL